MMMIPVQVIAFVEGETTMTLSNRIELTAANLSVFESVSASLSSVV